MTEEEFKKWENWHNKLESARKAKQMLERIFNYTKPNVADMAPVVHYMELMSMERQEDILLFIFRKVEEEIEELEIEFKNNSK